MVCFCSCHSKAVSTTQIARSTSKLMRFSLNSSSAVGETTDLTI
jgi:hypothetical protein